MTDSRHYDALSASGALRFNAVAMSRRAGDVGRVHGTDERVGVEALRGALCTTRRALRLFGGREGGGDGGSAGRGSGGSGGSSSGAGAAAKEEL